MNHINERQYENVLRNKKSTIDIKFHPNDTILLKDIVKRWELHNLYDCYLHFVKSKLIDETPGVKDINGDPKLLNALWVKLTKEYNSHAMRYRTTAILRRRFKYMRTTMKRYAKEEFRLRHVSNPPDFDNLPSTFCKDDASVASQDPSGSNDPPLDQPRINFANVSFFDAHITNNERLLTQEANNIKEKFDPFSDEGNQSYFEEDSAKESNHGAADEHTDLTALQRTLLETEIACTKEAHQNSMAKMKKYHDLKMFELRLSIENMKSKHNLEMQYLRLKMQQCRSVQSGGREDQSDRWNEKSMLENNQWNVNAAKDGAGFVNNVAFNNTQTGVVGN